jgi:hypothetical protein
MGAAGEEDVVKPLRQQAGSLIHSTQYHLSIAMQSINLNYAMQSITVS